MGKNNISKINKKQHRTSFDKGALNFIIFIGSITMISKKSENMSLLQYLRKSYKSTSFSKILFFGGGGGFKSEPLKQKNASL